MIEGLLAVLSGILSGMGMGGGVLLIPALTLLLSWPQFSAQTVNLLAFLPSSLVALVIHIKNKRIKWMAALQMGVSGFLAAIGGAWLSTVTNPAILKKGFGIFLCLIAIFQLITLFIKKKNPNM